MHFASDNAGPVHPAIMAAMAAANDGHAAGYGNDPLTRAVQDQIRAVFEAPEAAVYLVATGTAANALILGTLTKPWETAFCTGPAHINVDECNAPEFYTGGAKLSLVPDTHAKMGAADLRARIAETQTGGVHGAQRGPVSITQVTERGTLYSLDEIAGLTGVAGEFGLKVHLDGARFANAQVALGCSAADMTWRAGIDAVSFGGTKNGCMGVEACVIFDPALAWEFELRRKRGAHLFSKHRYLAAQMQGYLADDLWLDLAARSNAACRRLADGLCQMPGGSGMQADPAANMIYMDWPRGLHQRLFDAGAIYYIERGELAGDDPDELLTGRLVCDWSVTDAAIDRFLGLL